MNKLQRAKKWAIAKFSLLNMPAQKFHIGNKVKKVGGDYQFEGVVVSVFLKLSGVTRYVVEDDRGVLHVYSEKNLEAM